MSAEPKELQRGDTAGWLGRLRHGLGRSSSKLSGGITGLFGKRHRPQGQHCRKDQG